MRNQPHQPSRRRRLAFRLIALSLPVLGLLVLELMLRVVGYGFDPGYFHQVEVNGQAVWIENRDFTKRFFPPGLARMPQPLMLPVNKDARTTRIFVFGESAAMGDPAPAYGFSRFLEILLKEQYPGREFEIANLATTAISSHVVREIAREAAPRDGDIWIVYMGNNEVVGPYGAGTVFSAQTPGLFAIRAGLAIKATRVGQSLDALRRGLFSSHATPEEWGGMEMFLQQQVSQGDPAMDKVYAHFASNLRDIVQLGLQSGARVLVSTVASNLKDCSPFASKPSAPWSEAQADRWTNAVTRGMALMGSNDFSSAMIQFEEALAIDDQFAEVHFQKARCALEQGDMEQARREFERARDLDTLRFRADGTINQIIRDLAVEQESDQILFLDGEAVVNEGSLQGIAGHEYLFEHVHFNPAGNLLLARAITAGLGPWLGANENTVAQPLTDEQCYERLALTDWNRLQILDEVVKRLQQPPFNQQWNHRQREIRLEETMARLQGQLTPEGLHQALGIYAQALEQMPRDYVLRVQYAAFLEETRDLPAAEAAWREVLTLRPMSHDACFHLANTLDKMGRSEEAVRWFNQALELEPDLPEARNGLALALAALQRQEEAQQLLETLVEQRPDFVEARINLGQLLAEKGQDDLAEKQYRAALARSSNSVAARINLGRLLGRRGDWNEAVEQYQHALLVDPNNAVAYFNLGNALDSLASPEALSAYAQAVVLDPSFTAARYNYGLALAKAGRMAEALAQFEQVAQQEPAMAEGRFNYGVALAKMKRFDEAMREFEATLALDPAHTSARQFLEQAKVMAGGNP